MNFKTKQTRGNSISKQIQPTKQLEIENNQMSDRIIELKSFMSKQREDFESVKSSGSSRWQAASTSKPIKNYATNVLNVKRANLLSSNRQTSTDIGQGQENKQVMSQTGGFKPLNLKNCRPSSGGKGQFVLNKKQKIPSEESRPPSSSSSISKQFKKINNQSLDLSLQKSQVSSDSQDLSMDEAISSQNSNQTANKNNLSLSVALKTSRTQNTSQPTLASNLNRAMLVQKDMKNEVVTFLIQLGLVHHAGQLLENGFDDMKTLFDIQISHLQEMKIPPKEGKILLRKIQKMQISEVEISEKKSEQKPKIQLDGGSLLDGKFDEKESHQSFLEALMAFRGVKTIDEPTEEPPSNLKKTVRFDQNTQDIERVSKRGGTSKPNQSEEMLVQEYDLVEKISSRGQRKQNQSNKKDMIQQDNKMKNFFLFDSSGWSNDNYPAQAEIVMQTEQPVKLQKDSCWTCFRLIYTEQAIHDKLKTFCSQDCLEKTSKKEIKTCRNHDCQKVINPNTCLFQFGHGFCDQSCSESFQWQNKDIENIRGKSKQTQIQTQLSPIPLIDAQFDLNLEPEQQSIYTLEQLDQLYDTTNDL